MIDISNSTIEQLGRYLSRKIRRTKNKKLGPGVLAFSLPHGRKASCPFATDICESICYVDNYSFRSPLIPASYDENFQIAKRKDFGEILKLALSYLPPCILRIHVSGDFFSVEYIVAWAEALEANQHIKPFGFTRSWRDPGMRKTFERYNMNRYILASTDSETGPAPSNWRAAVMNLDVKLNQLSKGIQTMPKFLCNEQNFKLQNTCADCGRCGLVKQSIKNGNKQFIQLRPNAIKYGVVFAAH
jgi:hypothetical protein